MKRKTVAVVDYGSGNLRSVSQAVQQEAARPALGGRHSVHQGFFVKVSAKSGASA